MSEPSPNQVPFVRGSPLDILAAASTRANVRRAVMALAGPALTEQLLVTLMEMLNLVMVSRLGAAATAAVGLTNQPVFFATAAFMALNVGTTAIVARSIGAGRQEEANAAARQSLALCAVLAVVLSTGGFLAARHIMTFMGAGPDVMEKGTVYFRLASVALAFNALSLCLTAVLRGAGDTTTPMRINVVADTVVLVVGLPLIYGLGGLPRLGVLGAGAASIVARVTSAVLALLAVTSGRFAISFRLRGQFRLDLGLLRRVLRVGFPAALEQFVMRGGQLQFARVVSGLGTASYAAHQISINLWSFSLMIGFGFAAGVTALVGQCLGARRPDWAERCAREGSFLAMMLSGGVGLICLLLAPWAMRLYTPDPAIVSQGSVALRIIGVVQPAQAAQLVLAGGLRGAGDTRWPLFATTAGMWGFRVVLAEVFVRFLGWGLAGAWGAMAVDQMVRAVLISYRFRTGKWKRMRV
ncbi:MAG: MATE family efflux transporter [Acetobacteraceae bacterium]|nr:MATE family efflux transporter [Acetobacteraceae bacterium]